MLALSIDELTKVYPNGILALNGISVDVAEGDFFALLGPNGAGKSTTISIVTSLMRKTAGTVRVFGHDVDRETVLAKSCVGVVPQEFNFGAFEQVEQVLVNQAGYYGLPLKMAKPRAQELLQALDLWDKRHLQTRMLSGGMKRRLLIARALIHKPRLLILDEPTAGVDIEIRRMMWHFLQKLNKSGTTIILTTHYLEEAEQLCRNIAIINKGKIITNEPMRDLLAKVNVEHLILDLQQPLAVAPILADFEVKLIDTTSLEVAIFRHQSLNDLFVALDKASIVVRSLRNKTNRLEELFFCLTEGKTHGNL